MVTEAEATTGVLVDTGSAEDEGVIAAEIDATDEADAGGTDALALLTTAELDALTAADCDTTTALECDTTAVVGVVGAAAFETAAVVGVGVVGLTTTIVELNRQLRSRLIQRGPYSE